MEISEKGFIEAFRASRIAAKPQACILCQTIRFSWECLFPKQALLPPPEDPAGRKATSGVVPRAVLRGVKDCPRFLDSSVGRCMDHAVLESEAETTHQVAPARVKSGSACG